jgi:hypothetical protein
LLYTPVVFFLKKNRATTNYGFWVGAPARAGWGAISHLVSYHLFSRQPVKNLPGIIIHENLKPFM